MRVRGGCAGNHPQATACWPHQPGRRSPAALETALRFESARGWGGVVLALRCMIEDDTSPSSRHRRRSTRSRAVLLESRVGPSRIPIAAAPATLRDGRAAGSSTRRGLPNFSSPGLEEAFPRTERFVEVAFFAATQVAAHCGGGHLWRNPPDVYRLPARSSSFFRSPEELSDKTYQARILDVGLPKSAEFASSPRRARTTTYAASCCG